MNPATPNRMNYQVGAAGGDHISGSSNVVPVLTGVNYNTNVSPPLAVYADPGRPATMIFNASFALAPTYTCVRNTANGSDYTLGNVPDLIVVGEPGYFVNSVWTSAIGGQTRFTFNQGAGAGASLAISGQYFPARAGCVVIKYNYAQPIPT